MNPVLLQQWPLATAARVLSASDEEGLTHDAPAAATANNGNLGLGASGTPLASGSLDLALVAGGLAMGFSTPTTGYSSAAARWKNQSDSSSQWRGYSNRLFMTYFRVTKQATSSIDYPHASGVRHLADGGCGFVHAHDAATDLLVFRKKSSRTGLWSTVTISSTGIDASYRPDLVVLASGRLLALSYVSSTDTVQAWYSDDDGATWSSWSTDTRIDFEASSRSISAAVVGDAICVVTGATYDSLGQAQVYWSFDAGQSFVLAQENIVAGSPRVCATANGRCILAYVNTTTGNVETYPLVVGGGIGAGTAEDTGLDSDTANGNVGICLADDGSLWLCSGNNFYPTRQLSCRVSLDNGATWLSPGGSSSGDDDWFGSNASTERGYRELNLGEWNGEILLTAVSSCQTAAHDNALHEMHFGGWDSMSQAYANVPGDVDHSSPCGDEAYGYAPHDYPENVDWTRTDVGAGATRSLEDTGLRIVSTAADNTYWYQAPPFYAADPGDALCGRFYFVVNSGPATPVTGVMVLFLSIGDGANRQWIEFEFGLDQVTIRDTGGQIAASASVANQFTSRTELFFAFAHDYPSAGGGTVSAWYRIAGSTHWTQLASNVAVAEQAGVATERVIIGGSTVTASGSSWDIAGPFLFQGGGGLVTGFTNPSDLVGRELSSSSGGRVTNGLRLAAFGGPGVQGDTYTQETTAHYAARNLWLSPRPSCQWRATHDVDQNVVFGGDDRMPFDTVVLLGTNVRVARVQFNNTNSWGSPSLDVSVSAEVWKGVASANEAGLFAVDGEPFVPHQWRSRPGRRWFVEIGTPPGLVYEIADNTSDLILVDGLADTFGGAALRVFGDRMGAVLPRAHRFVYARLLVEKCYAPSGDDSAYRAGSLVVGRRHEMEIPYDTGFVERWLPGGRRWRGDRGFGAAIVDAPERHEIRLAWGAIDALSTRYMQQLVDVLRAAEGEARPVVLWRDPVDPRTLGLYTVKGPPSRENIHGELADELARLAQVVLVEEM